jgi:S1-C subfamily serine protease
LSGSRSNDRNDRDGGRNKQRDFRSDFKFGRATDRGLTISTITQGSIFYRSGLRNGDVIISYNGRPIRSESDFTRVVVYQPGERVPVVVLRDGREETIYVVYEEDVAQTQSVGRVYFGAEFDPQSRDAAVVVRVDEGSPAAEAGLQRDDIVLAMNGDEVRNGQDAMQIINSLNEGDRVEIEFSRNVRTEAVLTGSRTGRAARTTDTRVDQANHEAGVAGGVGVGVDQTRRSGERSNSEYNSRDRENRDSDRNSRENRRILPRLRN